jgi:predicted RNA-binding protein with PUA-like domain
MKMLQGYDVAGPRVNGVKIRPMWLLKTEPESYSWADLQRDRTTRWDGVRNPVAQKNLRAMQAGDAVVLYHTGKERAAVGLAKVVRAAYPDPKDPELVVVDLEAVRPLPRAVTLDEMKSLGAFEGSPLLRQGRLAVVPLTREQLDVLTGADR